MAESSTEVMVGAAVLAAAIGFVAYVGNVTGMGNGGAGSYPLHASFRSVDGISVGTEVRLAGVKVGQVTDLELNPTTFRADATITIRDDFILPDDSSILVSAEGLLGGNYIELVPGGSPFDLEPGGEILDTQGSVSMVQLLMKFVGAAAGDSGATQP